MSDDGHHTDDEAEEAHPLKASVEFNLEKEPLQSGPIEPTAIDAEKVRMGQTGRSSRGWLVVALLVLLLIVSSIAEHFADGVISKYIQSLFSD